MGETVTGVRDEDGYFLAEVIQNIPRGLRRTCVIPSGVAVWGCLSDLGTGPYGWQIIENRSDSYEMYRLNGWRLFLKTGSWASDHQDMSWFLEDVSGRAEEIYPDILEYVFPVDVFRMAEYIILHGWPEWMTT